MHTVLRDLYDGVPMAEVEKALVLAARSMIEQDPAYSLVTARLLLNSIRHEVLGEAVTQAQMGTRYAEYFPAFIKKGIDAELLDEKPRPVRPARLAEVLDAGRDYQFGYLGLQTLYDRYFLHIEERRIELPQAFFMRVAMGLAINEIDREARAIEFYKVLSSFDFMSSTPTLFNAGTRHSQLSSCYLTTVTDDLDGIYQAIKENAMLQKYAGGLGNDWTPVRAMGARIKGTNGKSQGVVPFLKVVNDTAVAVNQGGKRKGAVCAYLETWHLDIEEFLDLRKNTGDDRRRTHDMNTANWIPDLFMKRVMEGGDWTLFSPNDVPDLHDLYGRKFDEAYTELRAQGRPRRDQAVQAHPRRADVAQDAVDAVRDRPSLDHVQGPVQHPQPAAARRRRPQLQPVHRDHAQYQRPRSRGVQPRLGQPGEPPEGRQARPRQAEDHHPHRDAHARQRGRRQLLRRRQGAQFQPQAPSGGPRHHGLPGCAAGTARGLRVRTKPSNSPTARWKPSPTGPTGRPRNWPRSAAAIPATKAACGAAASCRRIRSSCWPKSAAAIWKCDSSSTLDWDALRERIGQYGMRNSNCLAIAPTATIANIVGVSASIEPTYQNIYVKSNLSGEFTVANKYLVNDLKKLGLWDEVMVADIKYFDGSLAKIDRIPADIRTLYATAFEMETKLAGGMRLAPPEVDRPGAEPQHLHGRRLGQEARRHLQAGMDPRPEDHVLPAHAGRHLGGEIHRQGRRAECRVVERRGRGDEQRRQQRDE